MSPKADSSYPDPVLVAASMAACGWPVIPLWPGTKKPVGEGGERHRDIWQTTIEGVLDFSSEHHEESRQWPAWGVILGEPNEDGWRLTVLDTDSVDSEQRLRRLLAEDPEWSEWAESTLTVQTNRGIHRYAMTRAVVGTCKPWEEFDLKDSGYVLLPGSKHPSGLRYMDLSPEGAQVITATGEAPPLTIYRPVPNDGTEESLRYGWAMIAPAPAGLLPQLVAESRKVAPDGLTTAQMQQWLAEHPEATYVEPARVVGSLDRTGSTAAAAGTAYEKFLATCRDYGRKVVKRNALNALVSCPGPNHSNGDRNPSLSVGSRADRVLLKCFSGCPTDQIVAAIGLTLADLFVDPDYSAGPDMLSIQIEDDEPYDPDAQPQVIEEAEQEEERLLSRDDLDSMPEPDEIIGGVLPARGTLAMMSGSRGLGKSLLALDFAAHLSLGLPHWHDERFPVRHTGTVIYISREGFQGVPKRVMAWEQHWAATHEGEFPRLDAIWWWRHGVDLRKPEHVQKLLKAVLPHEPVMIVVDSAAATGAGKEDTQDMGDYVAGLEALRTLSGAFVLVLHNTGWDDSRERGSTILPDRCDMTLHLEGTPTGVRTLKHRKQRDGDTLEGADFLFGIVEGTNSGVLVYQPRRPGDFTVNLTDAEPSKAQTEAQRLMDDGYEIRCAVEALYEEGADEDGWIRGPLLRDRSGVPRNRYMAALAELVEREEIAADGSRKDRRYRLLTD